MVFDADEDESEVLIGRIWITLEPNSILFQSSVDTKPVEMYYRKPKWYNIMYDATDEVQG